MLPGEFRFTLCVYRQVYHTSTPKKKGKIFTLGHHEALSSAITQSFILLFFFIFLTLRTLQVVRSSELGIFTAKQETTTIYSKKHSKGQLCEHPVELK